MVKRLHEMPEVEANHLRRIECPTYEDTPPLGGKPLVERRVAIISTAGLHRRSDRPFRPGDGSYRVRTEEEPASAEAPTRPKRMKPRRCIWSSGGAPSMLRRGRYPRSPRRP